MQIMQTADPFFVSIIFRTPIDTDGGLGRPPLGHDVAMVVVYGQANCVSATKDMCGIFSQFPRAVTVIIILHKARMELVEYGGL